MGEKTLGYMLTLSEDKASISFMARAKTRLPLRVNHLYVSSYPFGTTVSMVLMVSGAPLTAIRSLPPGRLEMVDMRLRAEENWKRRLIINCVLTAELRAGMTTSPKLIKKIKMNCDVKV